MLQFILFRAAERSGRREETRAHAPRGRPPAGPPHLSFPKGEIPVCFPLGPKTDHPEGNLTPPRTLLKPPFLSSPWSPPITWGEGDAHVFFSDCLQLLKYGQCGFGILSPFQTGGGWGGSHTHPRAHTHAHTHALTPASASSPPSASGWPRCRSPCRARPPRPLPSRQFVPQSPTGPGGARLRPACVLPRVRVPKLGLPRLCGPGSPGPQLASF